MLNARRIGVVCSGLALFVWGCSGGAPEAPPSEAVGAHAPPGEEAQAQPVARRITAANAEADVALHLVARTYISDDEVAEFYEPAPGRVLFSMAGSPAHGTAVPRAAIEGKSIDAIWAHVAPKVAMPETLSAAVERARALPSTPRVTAGSGGRGDVVAAPNAAAPSAPSAPSLPSAAQGGERVGTTGEALTNGYCGTQWLKDFPIGAGHTASWLNLDRTWYEYYYINPGSGYYYNVCSEIGVVRFNLQEDSSNGNGAWDVPQNTYRWVSNAATICYEGGWGVPTICFPNDVIHATGSVTPLGNATYNWGGTLDW